MRILFHNCRLLHPLHGGDRIRTYNMLRELRKKHHITCLTFRTPEDTEEALQRASEYAHETIAIEHDSPKRGTARFFKNVIINTLFKRYPYIAQRYASQQINRQLTRLTSPAHRPAFDIVICDYLSPMVNFLQMFCQPWPPLLLFQHNVESMIFQRHAATTRNPLMRFIYHQQWKKTVQFEKAAAALARAQVTVSESDAEYFRTQMGMTNILGAVPTGVDCDYYQPAQKFSEHPRMAFLGAMDWQANQDAVRWFCDEILPQIHAQSPAAEFLVIGRNPPDWLQARSKSDPRIQFTGTVPDVRPHMLEAAAMVLPLRVGGGTRIKIYEAMAMGVPVVSTRIGAEGLDVTHDENILLAESPAEFAAACTQMLTERPRAARIATAARKHVEQKYAWSKVADIFDGYCEAMLDGWKKDWLRLVWRPGDPE